VAVRMLLREMGALSKAAKPSPIIGDNKETVAFATKNKMTKNMRHVPECYHLTREWYAAGEIAPLWCPGTENPADLLSKPVSSQALDLLRGRLCGYADAEGNLEVYPEPERAERKLAPGRTPDWAKFDELGPRFYTGERDTAAGAC
jgi:hypothetical protein